jgi:pSer/pThr/pTyr-binding forkhead associated (FHA) protein
VNDLEFQTISRHHCLLRVAFPDIRVMDFGSRNGTYVNGARLRQHEPVEGESDCIAFSEQDLKEGDQITVGTTVLSVKISPRAPACVC